MKHKITKISICLSLFCSLWMLSACDTKKMSVCTTSYPVAFLVERIGTPQISACNISNNDTIQIAKPNEDFEKQLENAQTLIYISGMEPYFDVYADNIRSKNISYMDIASKLYLYPFGRYTNKPFADDDKPTQEMYYQGDVFDAINVYKKDPAFWMDPMTMLSAAEVVRDFLVYLYPEYTDDFTVNFDELELELTRLDADYQLLEETAQNIAIASMSANFGYYQTAFGIQVYPVSISKYGALPNEMQLAIIKQKMMDENVRYIANEENLNEGMEQLYQELIEELGLIPVTLSNVSSLSDAQRKKNKDYLTIMYENLTVLEGLGE
ncbi:MAG: metal ABC transporter substrate-binding protein [Breznakia sp.]